MQNLRRSGTLNLQHFRSRSLAVISLLLFWTVDLFRSDVLYFFNMVSPCTCVRKVWLFSTATFFGSFVHCLWSRHDVGRIWKRFRPTQSHCHVHLAEHSTRSVVLLNVSLQRADESQVARNSCPRLPRLILGLVSIMSLSC